MVRSNIDHARPLEQASIFSCHGEARPWGWQLRLPRVGMGLTVAEGGRQMVSTATRGNASKGDNDYLDMVFTQVSLEAGITLGHGLRPPAPLQFATPSPASVSALAGANAKNVSSPPVAAAWPEGGGVKEAVAGARRSGSSRRFTWALAPARGGTPWCRRGSPRPHLPQVDHQRRGRVCGHGVCHGLAGPSAGPRVVHDVAAFGYTMSFAPTMEDAKPVPFGHTPNFLLHHHHQQYPSRTPPSASHTRPWTRRHSRRDPTRWPARQRRSCRLSLGLSPRWVAGSRPP
uniref:Uncharacterized protein n=1 Tax=Zea mays TaxID=4577 RepID=A0A804PV49_MAIZE